jgi:hypothetical protein
MENAASVFSIPDRPIFTHTTTLFAKALHQICLNTKLNIIARSTIAFCITARHLFKSESMKYNPLI